MKKKTKQELIIATAISVTTAMVAVIGYFAYQLLDKGGFVDLVSSVNEPNLENIIPTLKAKGFDVDEERSFAVSNKNYSSYTPEILIQLKGRTKDGVVPADVLKATLEASDPSVIGGRCAHMEFSFKDETPRMLTEEEKTWDDGKTSYLTYTPELLSEVGVTLYPDENLAEDSQDMEHLELPCTPGFKRGGIR